MRGVLFSVCRQGADVPRVFVPVPLQHLTGGTADVVVEGTTVRSVLENLEAAFPGVCQHLRSGDGLRSGLAVAVDGNMSSQGLLQKVREHSEVHFVAAIGGG